MLTDQLFIELVEAASLAPSADNMQPWEFQKHDDAIDVFCAKPRVLPTDVVGMFAWIAIGAAIENIEMAASARGLVSTIEYNTKEEVGERVARIRFLPGTVENCLADGIAKRTTNRYPFEAKPLDDAVISTLSHHVQGMNAGIHWLTDPAGFEKIASMDARSSYIRLGHKPLHDELFDILRFTPKEIKKYRFGLTFESLEVPRFAVSFARLLQFWSVNRLVSRLGFDRLVAKQLSVKLKKSGALCLVTARQRDPMAYMEAGRALEKIWLSATVEGLSVQPYGVLPQYLTKVEVEPETFLPKYAEMIRSHREPFFSLFPEARNEYPALLLRIGKATKQSARSDMRLKLEQIIRV